MCIPKQTHEHEIELKVRDYECDMDHVVNNAVYLNYLEHARHEYLGVLGIRFAELSKQGVSLVVTRIEADFKASLVSGDVFRVYTALGRRGRIRFEFRQTVRRTTDNRLMLSAVVTGTALNKKGRPEIPPVLDLALGELEKET